MSRILLVDDNTALLTIQREVLRRVGHTVVTAQDGDQALAAVAAETFDLVVTDLIMPGKEGIEIITELRQSRPSLRIIATSGGGRVGLQSNLDAAKAIGADLTLEKPFRIPDLLAAIDELLGAKRD